MRSALVIAVILMGCGGAPAVQMRRALVTDQTPLGAEQAADGIEMVEALRFELDTRYGPPTAGGRIRD